LKRRLAEETQQGRPFLVPKTPPAGAGGTAETAEAQAPASSSTDFVLLRVAPTEDTDSTPRPKVKAAKKEDQDADSDYTYTYSEAEEEVKKKPAAKQKQTEVKPEVIVFQGPIASAETHSPPIWPFPDTPPGSPVQKVCILKAKGKAKEKKTAVDSLLDSGSEEVKEFSDEEGVFSPAASNITEPNTQQSKRLEQVRKKASLRSAVQVTEEKQKRWQTRLKK
jgi:hypothetical protein